MGVSSQKNLKLHKGGVSGTLVRDFQYVHAPWICFLPTPFLLAIIESLKHETLTVLNRHTVTAQEIGLEGEKRNVQKL